MVVHVSRRTFLRRMGGAAAVLAFAATSSNIPRAIAVTTPAAPREIGPALIDALHEAEDAFRETFYGRMPMALRVEGDAFAPKVCDGDTVVVDLSGTPEDGDLVAVRTGPGDYVLRRYWVTDAGPELVFDADPWIPSGTDPALPSLLVFYLSHPLHESGRMHVRRTVRA